MHEAQKRLGDEQTKALSAANEVERLARLLRQAERARDEAIMFAQQAESRWKQCSGEIHSVRREKESQAQRLALTITRLEERNEALMRGHEREVARLRESSPRRGSFEVGGSPPLLPEAVTPRRRRWVAGESRLGVPDVS